MLKFGVLFTILVSFVATSPSLQSEQRSNEEIYRNGLLNSTLPKELEKQDLEEEPLQQRTHKRQQQQELVPPLKESLLRLDEMMMRANPNMQKVYTNNITLEFNFSVFKDFHLLMHVINLEKSNAVFYFLELSFYFKGKIKEYFSFADPQENFRCFRYD